MAHDESKETMADEKMESAHSSEDLSGISEEFHNKLEELLKGASEKELKFIISECKEYMEEEDEESSTPKEYSTEDMPKD